MSRTFVMIKPDVSQSVEIVREIFSTFEGLGLGIRRITRTNLSRYEAEFLYEEHRHKPHFAALVDFTVSGPVILMVLEHTDEELIKTVRTTIGSASPDKRDPNTIRGRFAKDIRRNAVHGSDSQEAAERELSFFFGPL